MKHALAPTLLALTLGTAALTAVAQPMNSAGDRPPCREFMGPGHAYGDFMQMAEQLDLTADQKAQLEKLKADSRARIKPLMKQKRALHRSMIDTDAATMTPAAIEKHSREVGDLQAQLAKARLESRAAFAKILTPEQREKLKQLRDERREKHPMKQR